MCQALAVLPALQGALLMIAAMQNARLEVASRPVCRA